MQRQTGPTRACSTEGDDGSTKDKISGGGGYGDTEESCLTLQGPSRKCTWARSSRVIVLAQRRVFQVSGRWEEHDMARAWGKDWMGRWRPDHRAGASCASPRAVGGSEAFMPQHGEVAYGEDRLLGQPHIWRLGFRN